MVKAVIAEDESILRLFLSMTLVAFGIEIQFEAKNGSEAVQAVRDLKPNVAFLDINMETKEDGLEACREINAGSPETRVFFISAYPKRVFQEKLERLKYDGYLEKPVNKEHLRSFLQENRVILPA